MGLLHYHPAVLLYLMLAVRGSLNELIISPNKPLFKLGENLTLTCESTVPDSKPTWVLLDNVGVVQRTDQKSILSIASVSSIHEGKYTCSTKGSQKTTRVKVYDLPVVTLTTVPERPLGSQPFNVTCTVSTILDRDYIKFSIDFPTIFGLSEKTTTDDYDEDYRTYSESYTSQIGASDTVFHCNAYITIDSQRFQVRQDMTVHYQALPTTETTSVSSTSMQKTQDKIMTTTDTTSTTALRTTQKVVETFPTTETTSISPTSMQKTQDKMMTTTATALTTTALRTTQKVVQSQTKTMYVLTSAASQRPSQKQTPETVNPENEMSAVVTTAHPNAIIHGFDGKGQRHSAITATEESEKPLNSNRLPERQALPNQISEGVEESMTSSSSTGMIAGSTVGSVATLSLLGFLTHLIRRRRSQSCAPDSLPQHAELTPTV